MFKTNLRVALLGSGAAVAMMATAVPASAGQIDDLKAQIDALQTKLDRIEARQEATDSHGTVAPAAAVEAGDKPGTIKWPGTNTSFRVSGYVKLDAIYDVNGNPGTSFVLGAIPATGSAAGQRQGQFQMHAAQSRFRIQTWTPTDWGELATHIEGDFEGGGGNERVSNSYHLRLRHAFGRLGPVLAGQTWTNFMDVSALPGTIDFAGPTGGLFKRQAQIRYTHDFGGGWTGSVSAENPETFGLGAGTSGGVTANTGPAIDHMPDFTGVLKYNFSKGYMRAGVLLGENSVNSLGDTFRWGVNGSGAFHLTSRDLIGGQAHYIDGAGLYVNNGLTGDVACTGADVKGTSGVCGVQPSTFENTISWGGLVYLQHNWTDNIHSVVTYGYEQVNPKVNVIGAAAASGIAASAHYTSANVIWSPVSQVNIGAEVIYGYVDNYSSANTGSPSSKDLRFQLGMQYAF